MVAAINGTCLGGAFELALACHGRIAADGDKVRMGLPEVRVGLLPGAGGTQRVARLVNTQDALTMLLKGEQLKPARAKAMGLLDAVVPADDLIPAAKRWLKETPRKIAPWDEDGFKGAGAKSVLAAGLRHLAGGERALPQGDLRQLSRRARAPLRRLRGAAAPLRPGAQGRAALLRAA